MTSAREVIAGRLYAGHNTDCAACLGSADKILAALAEAGFTVARLEQVGWMLPDRNVVILANGPLPHEDGRPWVPIFRILPEEGASP